jgi:hypothetical protein
MALPCVYFYFVRCHLRVQTRSHVLDKRRDNSPLSDGHFGRALMWELGYSMLWVIVEAKLPV